MSVQLIKRLRGQHVDVRVVPVDAVPVDTDLVLAHRHLLDRVPPGMPPTTTVVAYQSVIGDPAVEQVIDTIMGQRSATV